MNIQQVQRFHSTRIARRVAVASALAVAGVCAIGPQTASARTVCDPTGKYCFEYEELPPIVNTLERLPEVDVPLGPLIIGGGPVRPTPTLPDDPLGNAIAIKENGVRFADAAVAGAKARHETAKNAIGNVR